MERAVIRDPAVGDDDLTAILQFAPEEGPTEIASGIIDQRSRAAPAEPGRPPSSSHPETFFSEALDSFQSETPPALAAPEAGSDRRDGSMLFSEALASRSRGWSGGAIGAAALAVVIAVGVPTGRWLLESSAPAVITGTLIVVTRPPGVTVLIDGTPAGTTPFNRRIPAGPHSLELRGVGPSRTMGVTVSADGQSSHYIELPGGDSSVGQLNLRSEPSGAFVTIDGVPRGITPIVADLAPGEHTLTLASDLGWVTQTVSITSGEMASLAVPATSWSVMAP
jgi:PEGA domain